MKIGKPNHYFAPIRVSKDPHFGPTEFILPREIASTFEDAQASAKETDSFLRSWEASNPVSRIAQITVMITEEK